MKQDPQRAAIRSGATYQQGLDGNRLQLQFMDKAITVTWPEGHVLGPDSAKELSLQEQVLILHYLLKAPGALPTGQWITFRGIPRGSSIIRLLSSGPKSPWSRPSATGPNFLKNWVYSGAVFQRGRGCLHLFSGFSQDPGLLDSLGRRGQQLPPDGNVLFDASIAQYLIAEDVAVLAGMVVYPLIGMSYQKGYDASPF